MENTTDTKPPASPPLPAPTGSARLDKHVHELHNLGNDLEEWCEICVRKDCVPKGARLVEAYVTAREIIVMGWPSQNDDDESHNCDAMGCGSVGSHVIYRLPLPTGDAKTSGRCKTAKRSTCRARSVPDNSTE